MEIANLTKYGITVPRIHIAKKIVILILFFLVLTFVGNALNFRTKYNIYTGKFDYYAVTTSSDNISVGYINLTGNLSLQGIHSYQSSQKSLEYSNLNFQNQEDP